MSVSLVATHAIADVRPQSGGTARVVIDLMDALCEQTSIQPVLITQGLVGEPALASKDPRVQRIIVESHSVCALKLGLPFRGVLKKMVRKRPGIIIHNHGLWLPLNHWAARYASQRQIPMIIQPHGMLEPWALNHRAWKKRIALAMFQRHDLESARALIATSSEEFENIRKLGLRQPIAVIPNGVKIDVKDVSCMDSSRKSDVIRTVLFLSRIHPKKGLVNLISAWSKIDSQGWRLVVAGSDENGHLQEIKTLAAHLGIEVSVEFVGMVEGELKSRLYRHADLFVLPTHSENFGVVVAEALAYGVPVITTHGAPWQDLVTYRCGWWIEIGVEPLVRTLQQAMLLSDDERQKMGNCGQSYVQRFDWGIIAQQTAELYGWVLGIGPKPDFILTD